MEGLGNKKADCLTVNVSKSIYDLEAVLRAAYKVTDRVFVKVTEDDPLSFGVHFLSKDEEPRLQDLENHFWNELIDQQIRVTLERNNRNIIELIVRKAFFPFETDH